MNVAASASRWKIVLAFGLVYVFWGSTYLGIGIAVEQIPPGIMCAVRFLLAGTVMLAYCALTGRRIRFSARQLGRLAAVGTLLLMGGNLTLSYAERVVPTGLAALLIAVTPLWFLVLDSLLLGDHRISRRGKIGLAIGIAGVVVLIWPDLHSGPGHTNPLGHRELWWSLALQLGSFSWAFGSVLSKKWQTAAADPFSAIAWQVFFAGLANLIFALLVERHSSVTWTFSGVAAILYLVVCGSFVGYTAYIWLLQHVPTSKVSTYAYVNPVVALFLGWLVLHERIDRYIAMGTAIIIASVVLVTSAKVSSRAEAEEVPGS
jgi:drug/metabolite transporter (DMT)-like permease